MISVCTRLRVVLRQVRTVEAFSLVRSLAPLALARPDVNTAAVQVADLQTLVVRLRSELQALAVLSSSRSSADA